MVTTETYAMYKAYVYDEKPYYLIILQLMYVGVLLLLYKNNAGKT